MTFELVVGLLIGGAVTYTVERLLAKHRSGSDRAAREHEAQLNRAAREGERSEEDHRKLVATAKGLYVELQTLGAQCTQWRDKANLKEVRQKWAEDLRPRVVDLSLMPQAGNRKAQKIAERLLREYEDLTHQVYLLSRQGPGHPHAEYTLDRYNKAQGETEFLLLMLMEAVGGKKAPSRTDWGGELRHYDDEKDKRDFAD